MRLSRTLQAPTGAPGLRPLWLALLIACQLAAFGWPAVATDAVPGEEAATDGVPTEEEAEEVPADVTAGLELLTELQGTIDRFAQLNERADHADAEGRSVFEHQTVEALGQVCERAGSIFAHRVEQGLGGRGREEHEGGSLLIGIPADVRAAQPRPGRPGEG